MNAFIGETLMPPTPAQASGHPNFVVDVPVQGPTDEGMRAGSCWWAQNVIPKNPSCVDCTGLVPYWTRQKLAPGGPAGPNSGIGDNMEAISFGGVGVRGFALSAAGDPEVWTKLTDDQRAWVANVFNRLNGLIIKGGRPPCPIWKPSPSPEAGTCIQSWFNETYGKNPPPGIKMPLRTDGVFDQDTFWATMKIVGDHPTDFPEPFPGTQGITTQGAPPEKKGLSTGAMAGLAVGGAAAVGGIIYVATRSGGKSRRRARK